MSYKIDIEKEWENLYGIVASENINLYDAIVNYIVSNKGITFKTKSEKILLISTFTTSNKFLWGDDEKYHQNFIEVLEKMMETKDIEIITVDYMYDEYDPFVPDFPKGYFFEDLCLDKKELENFLINDEITYFEDFK